MGHNDLIDFFNYTLEQHNAEFSKNVILSLRILRIVTGLRALMVFLLHPYSIAAIVWELWKLLKTLSSGAVSFKIFITNIVMGILVLTMIFAIDTWDHMFSQFSRTVFIIPVAISQLVITCVFTISRLCLKEVVTAIEHFSMLQKRSTGIFLLYTNEPFMKTKRGLDETVDRQRQIHIDLYNYIRKLNSHFSDSLFLTAICCRIGAFTDLYYFIVTRKYYLLRFVFSNLSVLIILCISSSRYSDMEEKLNNAISRLDFREFGEKKQLELELFQLQVYHARTNFTALKLFSFNLNFLLTIVTTTFGYMIIMKQLGA